MSAKDVDEAFSTDLALQHRVFQYKERAGYADPDLVEEICTHVIKLQKQIQDLHSHLAESPNAISPSRKRKLDGVADAPAAKSVKREETGTDASWQSGNPTSTVKDISVSAPVRKKLTLEFIGRSGQSKGGIKAVNPKDGKTEFALSWPDIEQVVAVPVPEKVQPQHNFVVIPSDPTQDSLVWSVNTNWSSKNISFRASASSVDGGDTWIDAVGRVLNQELRPYGRKLVQVDPNEFESSIVQAHRKSEKGYHVKAWRGSKDGYLYFLPAGIVFGFRKPILFFPFSNIVSISYSSVLQRTFNMTISATMSGDSKDGASQETSDTVTDYEFSMLDQQDFTGIDGYIKRHGLNDASLAASRRAQRYNVNSKPPKGSQADGMDGANGQAGDEDGEGELAKAERELQDAEDEEEEDFDPGSGGESDGSGSDSEEEGGGGKVTAPYDDEDDDDEDDF